MMCLWVTSVLILSICGTGFAYVYKISEEEPPAHPTYIGNIPNDTNIRVVVGANEFEKLHYSFLTVGKSGLLKYFLLNATSGDLLTAPNEVLDREKLCPSVPVCSLSLEVAIKSTVSHFFTTVKLQVEVEDINDNAPTFAESRSTLRITEDAVVGTSFPLPGAVDKDCGTHLSLQAYYMIPQDGPFSISYFQNTDGTSHLNLMVTKNLDHEVQNIYKLQIIATDGGEPPKQGTLNVDVKIIDKNDNKPMFVNGPYTVNVNETTVNGTGIVILQASDSDSEDNGMVSYRLSSYQPDAHLQLFSINAQTGELFVNGDLHREAKEKYDVIVEASDNGQPSLTAQTTLTVIVKDTINSPPRLKVHLLSGKDRNFSTISENANLGVVVAHIRVEDSDRGSNGFVQCDLFQTQYFELQGFSVDEYKVIVASALDRESVPEHQLTVVCSDSGDPSLIVNASFIVMVTDENDNSPRFSSLSYAATVEENNENGSYILRVFAEDIDDGPNAKVTYAIHCDRDELQISSGSGVITARMQFDFETKPVINCTVIATDPGIPPRTSVAKVMIMVLDTNDEVPKFSNTNYKFGISEYADISQMVGQVRAFDVEKGRNGKVEILGSNEMYTGTPFHVFGNGTIVLMDNLDYEKSTRYEFSVIAIDKGIPSLSVSANVRIDILDENDNPPVIRFPNVSDHSVRITTNDGPGDAVTSVVASDADSGRNSRLAYIITSRNDSKRFEIDYKSGDVIVNKPLWSGDINTYQLTIVVQDDGVPSRSTLTVLYVIVNPGDGVWGFGREQNILITVSIMCVTAVASAIIVIVIIVMRKRNKTQAKTKTMFGHLQKPTSLTPYVEDGKHPDGVKISKSSVRISPDTRRKEKENKRNKEIYSVRISPDTRRKEKENKRNKEIYSVRISPDTRRSETENKRNEKRTQMWRSSLRDVKLNEMSGEATASDSGRGDSDEDNGSHTGVMSSTTEKQHRPPSYACATSTRSGLSGSALSLTKVYLRDSTGCVKKQVTFFDMKQEKTRLPSYNEVSHNRYPNTSRELFRGNDCLYMYSNY